METKYIETTAVARYIRSLLKESHPGTKFSVKSHSYSGGSSIDISWTDGPSKKSVESVVSHLSGAGFDGSIDMQYSNYHYVLPDGSIHYLGTQGSAGSMGYIESSEGRLPEGAQRARLLADYVFCDRKVTPELRELMRAKVREYIDLGPHRGVDEYVWREIEQKYSADEIPRLKYDYDGWGVH